MTRVKCHHLVIWPVGPGDVTQLPGLLTKPNLPFLTAQLILDSRPNERAVGPDPASLYNSSRTASLSLNTTAREEVSLPQLLSRWPGAVPSPAAGAKAAELCKCSLLPGSTSKAAHVQRVFLLFDPAKPTIPISFPSSEANVAGSQTPPFSRR